jgi:3-deoxy-7-phosphoheptulonate synthase
MNNDGQHVHVESEGNNQTGLLLRGGKNVKTPADFENLISEAIRTEKPYLIDCAHGNSAVHDSKGEKSVQGQIECLEHVAQLANTNHAPHMRGIMLESYIFAGKGDAPGMSTTDPCLGFEQTEFAIRRLAAAHNAIIETN